MWSISHSWPRWNRWEEWETWKIGEKCSKGIDLIKHISLHRLDRVMEQDYTRLYIEEKANGSSKNAENRVEAILVNLKNYSTGICFLCNCFFCLVASSEQWEDGKKSVQRHHLITFYITFFLLIKHPEQEEEKTRKGESCAGNVDFIAASRCCNTFDPSSLRRHYSHKQSRKMQRDKDICSTFYFSD